jgi:hypothetical protein
MEEGFGRDFGRVRIHDNPRAAASAEAIGAHAYTVGNHIAFNRGQFRPETGDGRFLLAHELAHTVQQSGAPAARPDRISRPGDRHEAEAHRAAHAAVSGNAMPALSPGGAPIGRFGLGDIVDAAESVGESLYDAGEAVVDVASDVAGTVYDAVAGFWDTAVGIAQAVGGAISLDGSTIVIDIPEFDPCPSIPEFQFHLSDIGMEPSFTFPILGGGFTVGVLTVLGSVGVTATVDPGFGFKLADCGVGPTQLRISPLSGSARLTGAVSVTGGVAALMGADLGLELSLTGVLTIPATPPIVLVAPAVSITAGGTMALMLQAAGTITNSFSIGMGITGLSGSTHLAADLGFGVNLGYGLFGAISIGGFQLCRVGWPLGSFDASTAAHLSLDAFMDIGAAGFDAGFSASATPLAANPLADLGFAFDRSRLEDDCLLCDFFSTFGLFPGNFGKNWASLEPSLPRIGGPLPDIYARDPRFPSGGLCRGTCGVDCPPDPTCETPYDKPVCENVGDRHVWHTYVNYARCGTHQGCRDHDACYDYAAREPIWGFGGILIGPMYRACDLEALCTYSFQQAVTWATGGGPYDDRLTYADSVYTTPGCFGACPEDVAAEGEPETMQTCLDDRELWPGMETGDQWNHHLGRWELFRGFVEVPVIGGIHYGANAEADASASASAQLGPFNLEDACLTYDPRGRVYTGSADLALHYSVAAAAAITGSLSGWGSDLLCLAEWVRATGSLTAGAHIEAPGDIRGRVSLHCFEGNLTIIPEASLSICPKITGTVDAALEFFLLGTSVFRQEWPLLEKSIERCWNVDFSFEPFSLGEQPSFSLDTQGLDLSTILFDLFEPAGVRNVNRGTASAGAPDPSVFLPCLGGDDPPGDDGDCDRKATGDDGDRIKSVVERQPSFGPVSNLTVAPGATAGVATWMEAAFLTHSHGPGAPTNDTVQRGIYKQPGLPTNGCVGSGYKQSQVYIKGHLLNENLGGPAAERNLFPITGRANADHKNRVEQSGLRVVRRVNTGNELLYYKVEVRSISAPREIMTSAGAGTNLFEVGATFYCEVADYQLCPGDTLRRNAVQTSDIRSDFVFHPRAARPSTPSCAPARAEPRDGQRCATRTLRGSRTTFTEWRSAYRWRAGTGTRRRGS